MARFLTKFSVVLLAGVILTGRSAAADAPLAGKWKVMDVTSGDEVSLFILQIEEKDGKTTAVNLSSPLLGNGLALDDVKIDAASVKFSFKFRGNVCKVAVTADKDKPKVLRGSLHIFGTVHFAELVRTEDKEIDRKDAVKEGESAKALRSARGDEKALREVIGKYAGKPVAYAAAQQLLQTKAKDGKDDELKELAGIMVKTGAAYGPDFEQNTYLVIAQALTGGEKASPLAVEYARKAEKMLPKDAPASQVAPVLKTLVAALKKSGKEKEADDFGYRLHKIELALDEEFEKTAVPFKPEPFPGRKGKSSRVAVVELFTGAQCPPCVSADIAFDAAAMVYKPTDVVLLEYHLHIPGPDPLTNPDSEKRQELSGDDIQGTPTMFVNGKVTEAMGGFKQHGEERYKALGEIINKALETDNQAELKVTATRKGAKVDIAAEVKGLKKTGEKVKLRFVLVEDVVHYPARNGQRLHHHVVRSFPGGMDGFALKEATGKQAVTVLVDDLKKSLTDYLAGGRKFPDDIRPLEFKHLKVIALIQDDATKEILQAAQVDVPEAK